MTATLTKPKKRANGIALAYTSLRAALHAVRAAVSTRSPKPALLNVLLHNGGLTASNLELQISVEIPYGGEPLLLPFHRLDAILKAATGDEVIIEPRGTSALVKVGRGEWTLPCEDASEFPRWEPASIAPVARIPADQFCRAVRSVAYATDVASSRYALGGVLVEMLAGVMTFVATDGRRLSSYRAEVDQATDDWVIEPKSKGQKKAPLVPSSAIGAIAVAADGSEGAVQLEASANEVVATVDGTVITARLVEGRFPRWQDVFPKREAASTKVSAPELLAATRQAAIVTSEDSKGVVFTFSPEGIHLAARSSAAGESSVTCPIFEFGQPATVNLDPHFVCDFLRAVDPGVAVEINVAGPGDAVVLQADDYRGVIMPLAKE